jgi:hypothetical protein
MIVMAIRKISAVFITGAMTFEAPNDAIAMSMKTGNVQPKNLRSAGEFALRPAHQIRSRLGKLSQTLS